MSPLVAAYTLAFLVIAAVVFLIFRLKFFSGDGIGGRSAFVFGGLMLCLAVVWQIIKGAEAYPDWFLSEAYLYLDLVHLVVTVLGLIFVVVGLALFADHWQTKREQLQQREQRLSILNNIQADARQPYQLLELLEMALKEIVTSISETSGAILLFNRSQRQFILTASLGLSRDEVAAMEYYPIGRNPLTQAIELGDSALSGSFKFIDRKGNKNESRYNSCLILPMISGNDRIGVVVLLSPNSDTFDSSDLRYLEPLTEWLAEKIKGARIARNLASLTQKIDSFKNDASDLASRLQQVSQAFGAGDPVTNYCQSVVGLAGASSVHLVGIANGSLQIFGGSTPLMDVSENYRTALVDALDRRKPLIVNQEAGGDEATGYIAVSTLVVPCASSNGINALILRREGAPFSVGDDTLKRIEIFAGLAEAVLLHDNGMKLNTTRRKGFQKILELLNIADERSFEGTPQYFMRQLEAVLPRNTRSIAFAPANDGNMRAVLAQNIEESLLEDFAIMPGEGEVGQAIHQKSPGFATGRKSVNAKLENYETLNRDAFRRAFGEDGIPVLFAVCPILDDHSSGTAVFMLFDITEAEAAEYARMLTLAHGLFTVRQFVHRQSKSVESSRSEPDKAIESGRAINELNNRLAAILGCAELTAKRTDISSEVRDQIDAIIVQAETAADFLKDQTLASNSVQGQSEIPEDNTQLAGKTINEILTQSLNDSRISDNLYLIDGRTREVDLNLDTVPQVDLPLESLSSFARELLERFSRLAEEDDKISLSTYADSNYVYLDISRHRMNFPPVARVSGFGDYRHSSEVLEYRPADSFLSHLSNSPATYAYDRHSQIPSYLSFKFPFSTTRQSETLQGKGKRLLAIDDQAVILDLIRAMCQPLGYEVQTASSGEEGLEKARSENFDIVLTDLAMPGISGLEVARRISSLRPGTPIILVTGWEVKVDDEELEATGIKKVLFKPFRIEQLSHAIREVIADRSLS